jgi:hypothetical protein
MIDDWRCSIALLPMLLIENAQQSRQSGAAIETLRNGLVEGVVQAVAIAGDAAGRLIDARHNHTVRAA